MDNNAATDTSAQVRGFRLSRFEVLNWGTFDQQVWHIAPDAENSLLTGNIGSGKSTLVDGLTTLLVPTRKLAFNKAAGAQEKERSLESYFHGYYTSSQDDQGKARAIGLRQGNQHISVLLAQFHAEALQETVTLAQVMWLKPGERKVRRLFVVAEADLTIATAFSNFGKQINQLKKQLRKLGAVELFDSFPPYAQAFSKRLGLGADGKALELFNQTISMKSVGSVTDFVRQSMLEQPDVEQQLQELERNYDELKRLHDTVVDARRKVELLKPVSDYGEQAIAAAEEREQVQASRELTDHFVADLAVGLYQKRIDTREQALAKLQIQLTTLEQKKEQIYQRISALKEQIQQSGGGRLQALEAEIAKLSRDRDNSQRLSQHYQQLAGKLSLPTALDANQFVANLSQAKTLLSENQDAQSPLEAAQFEQMNEQQRQQQALKETQAQIQALKQRQSNIPLKQLDLRQFLCQQLGVNEARLPFVGELLQVKPDQGLWQGAIERVLHSFALSLMVPDDLYADISDLVEQTHLGARLVYFRVKQVQHQTHAQPAPDSLLGKLAIKHDSEHYDWLRQELERFDYQCCTELADFRRSNKAITPNGQIKAGKFRHEKDDRHNILDKRRYVLGWSNREKIALLEQQRASLETAIGQAAAQVKQLRQQLEELRQRTGDARALAEFNFPFHQLNWPAISGQIESLQDEKQQLEQSSDLLRELRQQLAEEEDQLAPTETALREHYQEQGRLEESLDTDRQALGQKQALLGELSAQQRERCFPTLSAFYDKHCVREQLRIASLEVITKTLRGKLNDRVQHVEERRGKKETQMVRAMGQFGHAFPNDVEELDSSLDALPEYQQLLKRLQEEDLPRHEARFKEMLNRDTIRAMALFRSQLDKQLEAIDARIRLINGALRGLDYQDGTYIEIDSIGSQDVDVREFQQRLKQCVEHSADESLYSEEKFLWVKDLIEQMRNEPRWTQKVVDVRHWQLFNVIERYREDNSEKECYSDSGGKSGGQKEKLAYSILAAAILLQYGLVDQALHVTGQPKRRFNLVVIDEAFARGSKDSTRFGLELFKKLGLQLLLVTPMQKLDVIEHYVKHVHFVDQRDNRSRLLNMTIDEYRERQSQHRKTQPYRALISELAQGGAELS